MLVEQLIRETLELQGFRIESVKKVDSELLVIIKPDLRYHPRCGICGLTGDYRDTLWERCLNRNNLSFSCSRFANTVFGKARPKMVCTGSMFSHICSEFHF